MVNQSKLISGLNNSTARPPPRRLPGDSAAFPCNPAAWLVAGAAAAGVVNAAVLRPMRRRHWWQGLLIRRWQAKDR